MCHASCRSLALSLGPDWNLWSVTWRRSSESEFDLFLLLSRLQRDEREQSTRPFRNAALGPSSNYNVVVRPRVLARRCRCWWETTFPTNWSDHSVMCKKSQWRKTETTSGMWQISKPIDLSRYIKNNVLKRHIIIFFTNKAMKFRVN